VKRAALIAPLAILAALVLAAPAAAVRPPRVESLRYFVRDDGELPHTRLEVTVRDARRVRLTTRFHGTRAGANPTFDDRISGHPWVLKHSGEGGDVYPLIRRSMRKRGFADVWVRAWNKAGKARVRLRIRESRCTKDPPFYPLDCTVHPR
jgi:hypothetical protein